MATLANTSLQAKTWSFYLWAIYFSNASFNALFVGLVNLC